MPATTVNFAGLDFATWGGGWPPDTVGDVSETHYIQAVNTSIGIWAKTGGAPLAAFTFASLWSGAGTGTSCDTSHNGDPTVIYDQMAKRWIVADFSWTNIQDGPYYECIAVSKTGNPVTGGWWLYAYRADDAAHPWLPDYPKMGIWPDGLYMTTNMFDCLSPGCASAAYKEVRVYAFDRADMYAGAPLSSIIVDLNTTLYFSLLPSNLRGAPPPAGRENLLVAESDTAFAFNVWKFHVDWVTPASSTFSAQPTPVSQASYNLPVNVPQPAGDTLDSLGDRMQMQAQYRNLGGTESLWVNHTVRTGGSGSPNGLQWAQINVTGGTIATTPAQQQIYGNVGGDGHHRWMGSLAVDGQGNMALGYSVASSTLQPAIRYNGRLAGDPLSTLPQGEATLQAGGGSQNGGFGRWGDYSAMTVDPDGCTFWYTTEYYAANGNNWQTRIGAFKFPGCTTTTSQGFLRVASNPAVATQISIDGVIRESWGLDWLKLPPGTYNLSFAHVEGYSEPAPQQVTISSGQTTVVNAPFPQRGSLRVDTNPPLWATISVDGVPRDDFGMWTDFPPGSYQVCFGAVVGFDPPPCQNATVSAGQLTTITGNYVANPNAVGETNKGFLRVASSPAVRTQIMVDGVIRDSWGLDWLKLTPGQHTLSFAHVEGYSEPAPQIVNITAGQTTVVNAPFPQRGSLRVDTNPPVWATISVDGVPRDDFGMWTDYPPGSYQVCFGPVEGKTAPPCQNATVTAGQLTTITGNYS